MSSLNCYYCWLVLMPLQCCAGDGLSGSLVQQQSAQAELGADISPLQLTVVNVDSTTLRVKIGAPGRWEVPRSLLRDTVNRVTLPTTLLDWTLPNSCTCMHAYVRKSRHLEEHHDTGHHGDVDSVGECLS